VAHHVRSAGWMVLGVALLFADLPGCGARGYIDEDALIDVVAGGGGGNGGNAGRGGSGGGSLGGSGGGGGKAPAVPAQADPYRFETHMLKFCQPGFVWSAGDSRACNFRYDGRCYDDDESVCACACPRNANSVCVLSGFLSDPGNPLMVNCQAK
jgi:hypothetical protein